MRITTIDEWKQLILEKSKYPFLRQRLDSEPYSYNIVGFHATNLDYWKDIQKTGLIPGKAEAPGQDFDSKWKGKAIYFHLDFPIHELTNGYDEETGQPFLLVIEARIHLPAEYIVPDEDVSLDVNYTPKAIKNKEAIAVGYITPPRQFIKIHLIDTPLARTWAKENINSKYVVEFHSINNLNENSVSYEEYIEKQAKDSELDNEDEEFLQYRIKSTKDLISYIRKQPDTFIVYRVLQLDDNENINKEDLGKHFISHKDLITKDFIKSIGFLNKKKLVLLSVLINKKDINVYRTIQQNLHYPDEKEIFINSSNLKIVKEEEIKL